MSSRRGMCPMRLETGDRIVVKRADRKGRLEKKVMSALGQKHMCGAKGDVRFTPKSGHVQCKRLCPLWAKSGHCLLYSNTSSAVSGIGSDAASPSLYIRKRGEGELAVRAGFEKATLVRPAGMFRPGDRFPTPLLQRQPIHCSVPA